MDNIYESDKYKILDNLKYVSETIIHRLYTTFDSIEMESKEVEEKSYEKHSQQFNPDTMDESFGIDEAYHEGVSHYIIHNQMKSEFINSSITWIFHLFEKDCNRIFKTHDGNKKKRKLEDIGINTSLGSLWSTCNHELRLVANTIKHGKGDSSMKLKSLKPNYFKQNVIDQSDVEIQLTIEEVENYVKALNDFWVLFFSQALPKYE